VSLPEAQRWGSLLPTSHASARSAALVRFLGHTLLYPRHLILLPDRPATRAAGRVNVSTPQLNGATQHTNSAPGPASAAPTEDDFVPALPPASPSPPPPPPPSRRPRLDRCSSPSPLPVPDHFAPLGLKVGVIDDLWTSFLFFLSYSFLALNRASTQADFPSAACPIPSNVSSTTLTTHAATARPRIPSQPCLICRLLLVQVGERGRVWSRPPPCDHAPPFPSCRFQCCYQELTLLYQYAPRDVFSAMEVDETTPGPSLQPLSSVAGSSTGGSASSVPLAAASLSVLLLDVLTAVSPDLSALALSESCTAAGLATNTSYHVPTTPFAAPATPFRSAPTTPRRSTSFAQSFAVAQQGASSSNGLPPAPGLRQLQRQALAAPCALPSAPAACLCALRRRVGALLQSAAQAEAAISRFSSRAPTPAPGTGFAGAGGVGPPVSFAFGGSAGVGNGAPALAWPVPAAFETRAIEAAVAMAAADQPCRINPSLFGPFTPSLPAHHSAGLAARLALDEHGAGCLDTLAAVAASIAATAGPDGSALHHLRQGLRSGPLSVEQLSVALVWCCENCFFFSSFV
jgi:hypothetical protein